MTGCNEGKILGCKEGFGGNTAEARGERDCQGAAIVTVTVAPS